MKYYSARYINTPHNFVIQNLPQGIDETNQYYKSLCVLKNILQRGSITPLSEFLSDHFGDYRPSEEVTYFIDDSLPDWKTRIKGFDQTGDYPARDFFNHIFAMCLPEYKFILRIMLPEAPLSMIIPGQDNYRDQCVDFYIPQANLVIEIDGAQHTTDHVQIAADQQRDRDLNNAGCTVVRITASRLKEGLTRQSFEMVQIRHILEHSDVIQDMKSSWEFGLENQEDYSICSNLQEIMAYQILLTELLLNGRLSLDDPSWIICLKQGDKQIFKLAYGDLMIWLKNLCLLRGILFKRPSIVFSKTSDISIDYSSTKRWVDLSPRDRKTLYIRLDYWDNVNYFKVCTASSPIDDYLVPEPLNDDLQACIKFFLWNLFGYPDFNDGQLSIILSLLRRHDTIGVLPTGSGKSLCYQIACLLQPSINFVVCPTVSLIQDQKRNLDEFGIDQTASISSDLSSQERQKVLDSFSQKRYLMIWISPERFQIQTFRDSIERIDSNLFSYAVIDEVHCLSEWGHDFRISYLTLIKTIRRYCSNITLCGLTATVSQFVLQDIKKEFQDKNGREPLVKATGSMERQELTFYVNRTSATERYGLLKSKIENEIAGNNTVPSGIVFAMTVDGRDSAVNKISPRLEHDFQEYAIGRYHGKMTPTERMLSQDKFMNNRTQCLVATKAFGMGVNKKNIRYTMHYGMPGSLEALYQEAGRAGRDRDPADCYILFDPGRNEPNVLEKLFDRRTRAEEIGQIGEGHISGDLSTIFYFWRTNNQGVQAEINSARLLWHKLRAGDNPSIVQCDHELNSDQLEKALYHFYLLGYVTDWTQESFQRGSERYTVYYREQSIDEWKNNLLTYIRKYDPEFLVDSTDPRDEFDRTYKQLLDENHCVELLITWLYDNIIYSRREMTKNVYEYCLDYRDSDSFKAKIDAYLKVSTDLAETLENIAGSPYDYPQWFNAFYETRNQLNRLSTERRSPEDIFRTSQRFIESYRNNTGINFVYSVSGLLIDSANEREQKEIYERFEEVFDWLLKQPATVREYVVENTIKLLEKAQPVSIELFVQVVLSRYPGYAQELYEKWGDSISLRYVMKKATEELHSIIGEFRW